MKHILSVFAALFLASCSIPESPPAALESFQLTTNRTYLADYTPSVFDGTRLGFESVRNGTFGECFERTTSNCPPSYAFGLQIFGQDKQEVYVGPEETRFRIMSVPATATGQFAFMGAYGNSGISEVTIKPDAETMVSQMGPGTVVVIGRELPTTDAEVRLTRQIMRSRFGEAADQLTYLPMKSVPVACTFPRPGLFGRDPARCQIRSAGRS